MGRQDYGKMMAVCVLIVAVLLAVVIPFMNPSAASVITYHSVDQALVDFECPEGVPVEVVSVSFEAKGSTLVVYENDYSFWGLFPWKTKKCVFVNNQNQ